MQWKVFCASATGKHHLDGGLPCQDAVHHEGISEGFVGVVCDGAGSASHGGEGAAFVTQSFSRVLARAVTDGVLDTRSAGEPQATVRALLDEVRAQLVEAARERELELRDFACTLVACVVTGAGGCFVHIGDGFAIRLDPGGQSQLSPPENGEYADETYFVTDDRWADHLRITTLPPPVPGQVVGLLSDGAAPFAVNRARSGFYPPFLDPIVAFLANCSPEQGNAALHDLLGSPKTFAITGDDKTLLLALAA